jgi:ectoine hydroxylase-related dioxygenase (phytanoyl-CoA dioxygenase family)
MIFRRFGYIELLRGAAPDAARELHDRGFVVLESALAPEEVEALSAEVSRVFDEVPADERPASLRLPEQDMFRYEMLNRSAACQCAIGNERVLEVIDPLLGKDCHVIANTAWRNPPGLDDSRRGDAWHPDAGPHVPRPAGVPWPDEIPYPVFAIGAHFLLTGSRLEDGPTGAIPGSHRSGQHVPFERMMDPDLQWEGEGCVPLLGQPGDVLLFVSDIWHRRMPTQDGEQGRFFLQAHYARRDIAQRLKTTGQASQVEPAAACRAKTARERALIGLHDAQFYDG